MVSTRRYREDIFNRLTKYGLKNFDNPEAEALLEKANEEFVGATIHENKDELSISHARILYRESQDTLDTLEEVLESDRGYKD